MKKFITLTFIVLSPLAMAQTEEGKTIERLKVYPVERANPSTENKMTKEEEIAYCEGVIVSLDTKEKAIRSNPEELEKANAEGWFEKAEKTRVEMQNRIAELKK